MDLRARGLSFSYHEDWVLKDLDFLLSGGDLSCILGSNGAGKSTLLKSLNGLVEAKKGSIELDERKLEDMKRSELARQIAYVPQQQESTLLSVFEVVLLGRIPHMGWSMSDRDYEVAEDCLELLGLEKLSSRPLDNLSGGERQKVAIARALAQEPEVILLDEPTSNLDLRSSFSLMEFLQRLAREWGANVIVAIHDLNMAMRYGDRFLFLVHGSLHSLTDRDGLNSKLLSEVYGLDVSLEVVKGHPIFIPDGSNLGSDLGSSLGSDTRKGKS